MLFLDLHQDSLETVVPKEEGAKVMIVTGRHKDKVNNNNVTSCVGCFKSITSQKCAVLLLTVAIVIVFLCSSCSLLRFLNGTVPGQRLQFSWKTAKKC